MHIDWVTSQGAITHTHVLWESTPSCGPAARGITSGQLIHNQVVSGHPPAFHIKHFDRPGQADLYQKRGDLIAASYYNKDSVPSVRPICTRCCFTMTNIMQAAVIFVEPEYLS